MAEKSTFNGSTNDARVHAQKVARARVAEKKAADEAQRLAALPYRGLVEAEAIRFERWDLINLLQRLNLWGKDTVHEMRKKS